MTAKTCVPQDSWLFCRISEVAGSQFATENVPPWLPGAALVPPPPLLLLLLHAAATIASASAPIRTLARPFMTQPPSGRRLSCTAERLGTNRTCVVIRAGRTLPIGYELA